MVEDDVVPKRPFTAPHSLCGTALMPCGGCCMSARMEQRGSPSMCKDRYLFVNIRCLWAFLFRKGHKKARGGGLYGVSRACATCRHGFRLGLYRVVVVAAVAADIACRECCYGLQRV